MKISNLLGLAVSILSLAVALTLEHLSFKSFLSISALLIIIGGTTGATMLSFPMAEFKNFFKIIKKALSTETFDSEQVIVTVVNFAQRARREGLLALEDEVKQLDNKFLRKGIELVIDGNDPELVRDILATELSYLESRHRTGQSIFESMGGYAPTMGMIGTVAGLIGVLASLKDPTEIGPKVALAFIAAFFGISMANLIFLPLASRLKVMTSAEVQMGQLMMEGILSIQAGDNPRIVEEKLRAFLSPAVRAEVSTVTDDDQGGEWR